MFSKVDYTIFNNIKEEKEANNYYHALMQTKHAAYVGYNTFSPCLSPSCE